MEDESASTSSAAANTTLAAGTLATTAMALGAAFWRRKLIASVVGGALYCRAISTLSKQPRDSPCPPFGETFRIMYGLFQTWLAELVLGYFLQTKWGEPQAEQLGGTTPVVGGTPELRIKIVPILGGAFGGNYSYIIWDGAAPAVGGKRPCIVVDPADPFPVYVASRAEGLQIEVCLCSHWHFDHAGGNRALARRVPGLQVVGGAGDFARTPAATRQVRDLEELTLGRIWMRAHAVPGHTRGSVVWEVGTSADADAPTAAFTGDTLFCGGCGALFESSADELHDSFAKLKARLRGDCFLYPGHEYTEMLLRMVVRREPFNLAAHKKLKEAELARARASCRRCRRRSSRSSPTTSTCGAPRRSSPICAAAGPRSICVEYLS